MRLHILSLVALLALAACDNVDDILRDEPSTVVAKAPDTFRYASKNKGHIAITIGSLSAIRREDGLGETTYRAPYSVSGKPAILDNLIVVTCRVLDAEGDLAGGVGFSLQRVPAGGVATFTLARPITDGKLVCEASDAPVSELPK